MADKTVKVSDLSTALADHRVQWSLGRKRYEIDLTDEEFAGFQKVLEPYVKASRVIRKARTKAEPDESE